MRHFFKLFAFALLFLHCTNTNQKEPKHGSDQWYCSTLSDLQTDPNDTTASYQHAVAYKDKFWPVGYKFTYKLINPTQAQKTMFRQACDAWEGVGNLKFTEVTTGNADLRITFNSGGGAWSYVGTDIRGIPQTSPTMNLGWLALDTYLHELGHTIGLLHEHQNPVNPIGWNEAVVIRDLSGPPNNWTVEMIRFNVLNPYPLPNVITTAMDAKSIMMYPIPASWTTNGFSSQGGMVISAVDKDFVGKRYPFSQPPTTGNITLRKGQVDTLLIQYNLLIQSFDATTKELQKTNDLTKKTLGRINPIITTTKSEPITVSKSAQ